MWTKSLNLFTYLSWILPLSPSCKPRTVQCFCICEGRSCSLFSICFVPCVFMSTVVLRMNELTCKVPWSQEGWFWSEWPKILCLTTLRLSFYIIPNLGHCSTYFSKLVRRAKVHSWFLEPGWRAKVWRRLVVVRMTAAIKAAYIFVARCIITLSFWILKHIMSVLYRKPNAFHWLACFGKECYNFCFFCLDCLFQAFESLEAIGSFLSFWWCSSLQPQSRAHSWFL